MTAALYTGHVFHRRLQPFHHSFRYRVFSLWLDLDQLPQSAAQSWLFSHNRFNMLSFHDKDHGSGDGTASKLWAIKQLQSARYPADDSWQIQLLCFPRLWGYVFNPLAIYYCSDAKGDLQAMLYQVSNTFGERHSYVVAAGSHTCNKIFHVSPFMPVDGGYRFDAPMPGERLDISIHYLDAQGDNRLVARQTGSRQSLNTATLLHAVLGHPLMTFKVMLGIHWQAVRLWLKGAQFFPKPQPPEHNLSAYPSRKVSSS